MGPHAGTALMTALEKNIGLRSLDLSDNKLDAATGFAFLAAIRKNKVLCDLHVREAEVGREAFHEIQKEMSKRFSRRPTPIMPPEIVQEQPDDLYGDEGSAAGMVAGAAAMIEAAAKGAPSSS